MASEPKTPEEWFEYFINDPVPVSALEIFKRIQSQARDEALEEAAEICDRWANIVLPTPFHEQRLAVQQRANEIRNLKSKSTAQGE